MVLVSGSGRLLQALLDAQATLPHWPARVDLVISSNPAAYALQRARQAGVVVEVASKAELGAEARDQLIARLLCEAQPDMVVLAGYLAHLKPPAGFAPPILNIHPSLLPRHGGQGMYGQRVHAAVLAAGDAESGCTVHHVDEVYDHGQIILQRRVPVLPGDTAQALADRVFIEEQAALLEAVQTVLAARPPARK